MTQKISLEQYIRELPIADEVRQDLLEQLARGEESEVKERVVDILRQTGLTLGAIEALNKVDADFEAELSDIEGQARSLIKSVSEESDKRNLEEIRQVLS